MPKNSRYNFNSNLGPDGILHLLEIPKREITHTLPGYF